MSQDAVVVQPRKISGSFRSFERRYGPIEFEGQIMLDVKSQIPEGTPAENVWSVLDCEGQLILSPGYRFVNRFGYVVCERPWGPSEENNTGYVY